MNQPQMLACSRVPLEFTMTQKNRHERAIRPKSGVASSATRIATKKSPRAL